MKQIPLSPALRSSMCHSSGILEGDEPGRSLATWSSEAGTGKHHCQGQRSGSVLTLYSRGPRLTLSHDVRNRFSEALAYTPPDFSSLCVRQPPMFIHGRLACLGACLWAFLSFSTIPQPFLLLPVGNSYFPTPT